MSSTSTTVYLDDSDLAYDIGTAGMKPSSSPHIVLGRVSVAIAAYRADRPLDIADAVLAAVTEWHAEIHRRGHAEPVKPDA